MIKELKPHKTGEKVESSGYYSCYKKGEITRLEKTVYFWTVKKAYISFPKTYDYFIFIFIFTLISIKRN